MKYSPVDKEYWEIGGIAREQRAKYFKRSKEQEREKRGYVRGPGK